MDPITLLSLAANIIQFVDFSTGILSNRTKILHSTNNDLIEGNNLHEIYEHLRNLSENLSSSFDSSRPPLDENALEFLAWESYDLAQDLLKRVSSLLTSTRTGKSQSLRKAWRLVWGEGGIERLQNRLDRIRTNVSLKLLILARSQINSAESSGIRLPSTTSTDLEFIRNLLEAQATQAERLQHDGATPAIEHPIENSDTTGISIQDGQPITPRVGHHVNNTPLPLQLPSPIPNRYVSNSTILGKIKSSLEYFICHFCGIYFIFLLFIIPSALITGMAVWNTFTPKTPSTSKSDNGNLSNISQGLNGILGVICVLVPLIQRNKDLQPEIPVQNPKIFRWFLFSSFLTAVLSMITGPFHNGVGVLLGFGSSTTQLAATLQLVLGSSETITSSQRDIEMLGTQTRLLSANLMEERRRVPIAQNEPRLVSSS